MQPTKDKAHAGVLQGDQTVWRTPNPQCPSCQAKRMHSREEFSQFHKEAGTGTADAANAIKKATDSPAS